LQTSCNLPLLRVKGIGGMIGLVPYAPGGSVKRKFVVPVLREEARLSVLTLGEVCSNCDGDIQFPR